MKAISVKVITTVILSSTLLVTACGGKSDSSGDKKFQETETQILWIADKKAECRGFNPVKMQCLMIQQITDNNKNNQQPNVNKWKYFYQNIKGFNWQEGKVSKIKVKRIHLNPKEIPEDISSVRYELVEVLK